VYAVKLPVSSLQQQH